jgi:hypothetical protein
VWPRAGSSSALEEALALTQINGRLNLRSYVEQQDDTAGSRQQWVER